MECLAHRQAAVTNRSSSGPFTQEVHDVLFPANLRLPQFKQYDGSTELEDHVNSFEIRMQLFSVDDAIICRTFTATFKGAVRQWLSHPTPGGPAYDPWTHPRTAQA
ncbi:hypothetical protein Dimus_038076 [Dionaea muscipula]